MILCSLKHQISIYFLTIQFLKVFLPLLIQFMVDYSPNYLKGYQQNENNDKKT